MKALKEKLASLHIAATLALTVGLLLVGCDQTPENDLQPWVNANAVHPFDQIEFESVGKDLVQSRYWALMRNGDMYRDSWPKLSLGKFKPARGARKTPGNDGPSAFDEVDQHIQELERRLAALEKALPHDTRLVPLEKISKSSAQAVSEWMKRLGFAGSGEAYLLLSQARCTDRTVDASGFDGWKNFLTLLNSKKEEIDRQLDQLDKAEQGRANIELANFIRRRALMEKHGTPSYFISECTVAGFASIYEASLFYVEGDRGLWSGDLFLDSNLLMKNFSKVISDDCGFHPYNSAVPDWVREACVQRQYVKIEATDGIAFDVLGRPRFYTHAGLVRFMNEMSWPNEGTAYIGAVRASGGVQ